MASVNSVNTGAADLLQTLAAASALPSALSSSGVQSALLNAAPADLIQLSRQALQLQQVTGLFGNSGGLPPGSIASGPTVAGAAQTPAEQDIAELFGSAGANNANNTISLLG